MYVHALSIFCALTYMSVYVLWVEHTLEMTTLLLKACNTLNFTHVYFMYSPSRETEDPVLVILPNISTIFVFH